MSSRIFPSPQPGARPSRRALLFWRLIMSDNNPTPSPAFDANDFLEKDRAFTALSDSIRPANKAALFDALAAAGITSVLVHFDGSGDSGQIEDIDATAGDQPREIPNGNIEIAQARWGDANIERTNALRSRRHREPRLRLSRANPWRLGEQRRRLWRIHLRCRRAHDHARLQRARRNLRILPAHVLREAAMGHCYHHALSSVKKWGGDARRLSAAASMVR